MDQSTSLEHKRALLLADVKRDVLSVLSGKLALLLQHTGTHIRVQARILWW